MFRIIQEMHYYYVIDYYPASSQIKAVLAYSPEMGSEYGEF